LCSRRFWYGRAREDTAAVLAPLFCVSAACQALTASGSSSIAQF
jgi:hypothetical protein